MAGVKGGSVISNVEINVDFGEVAVCSVSLSLGKHLKNYSHVNWLLRKPIMQGTMAFTTL